LLWKEYGLDVPVEVQVAVFLKEFKFIVTGGRGLDVIPRKKNIEALLELGITKRIRKSEILSLSKEDYYSGPKPDKDLPGDVWEFGKTINAEDVYIKLKIADTGTERIAKCISFHKAKFPLVFPLK